MLYRTDDAGRWGTGKGANLTPAEVDGNFWELAGRLVAVEESAGEAANGIQTITVTGSQMTVWLEDGTALGPYTLPTAMIRYRGDWTVSTTYGEMDLVAVPETGIYLVLRDHTSDAAFDANAEDASGNPLYRFLFPIGAGASSLAELSDVWSGLAPNANDVLTWDGTQWDAWPISLSINDLSGIYNIGAATTGQVLAFNTTGTGWWEPTDLPAGGGSVSVSDEGVQVLAAPADMNFAGAGVTVADDGDGTVTITIPGGAGGGAPALDDLSDVTIATPASGQVLRHDGSGFVNAALGWSDLAGVPGSFPPAAHQHTAAEISGLSEALDDRVAALLVAGTNVTLTYDDAAGSLTIDAAGGAGGGAATFLDLTDTPAAFGTPGQLVAVNAAGDGVGFIDPQILGDPATLETNTSTTAVSTSAYATKGEIFDVEGDVLLRQVAVPVSGDPGATYRLVIALAPGETAVISGILLDTAAQPAEAATTLVFDVPDLFLRRGQRVAILLVRADGTETAVNEVHYPTIPAASDAYWTPVGGARYASVDPAVGDATFYVANTTSVRMTLDYVPSFRDAPTDGQTYARKGGAWAAIDLPVADGAFRFWRLRLISEDQLSGTSSVYLGEIQFRSTAGVAQTASGGLAFGTFGSVGTLFDGLTTGTQTGAPYTDKVAGYDFGEPRIIEEVAVYSPNNLAPYCPARFVVEASNDNATWTEVARADPVSPAWSGVGTQIRTLGVTVPTEPVDADTVQGVTPSAFVLGLLDDADAAAARTTLGLGTMATQGAGAVAVTGGSITGLTALSMAAGSDATVDLGVGKLRTVQPDVLEVTLERIGLRMKNIYASTGGWARSFFNYTDSADASYMQFGGYGAGQSFTYGFVGTAYNDTFLRFYPDGGLVAGMPAGLSQGAGTINAVAVYDDGTLLCAPIVEAVRGGYDRADWQALAPHGGLDHHEAMKARGFDPASADSYAAEIDGQEGIPGYWNRAGWEARRSRRVEKQTDDMTGASVDVVVEDRVSLAERHERALLALDYAALAIRDLTRRVQALEAERTGNG